jgi:hypothetical protein
MNEVFNMILIIVLSEVSLSDKYHDADSVILLTFTT